ncbi:MAG: amidase family protein [Acidimicrobiales bacterium]
MDFRDTTVEAVAARVAAGEVSARELATVALERIAEVNPVVNAFVAVDGERALAQASAIDDRIAAGEMVGPLAGIPIGVKDLEDAAGFVTSQGSLLHAGDAPAETDSELVARLRRAGCVILGKTNTPEMGSKAHTTNKVFGSTRNPWNVEHTAGGSSGGTAAALAAGMVPLATGSDGGGSIRIPASVCGFTGFKPSLGRVPAGGDDPPGWGDLSSKGPMARAVRDSAFVLDQVLGPEPTDLRSLPMPTTSWRRALDEAHAPLKVAWSPTLGYAPVDPEVLSVCEEALARLSDFGTEVVEEPSVFDDDPVAPWMVLTSAGNLRTVAHLRGTDDWDRLDDVVRSSATWAERLTGADVLAAEDACHRLNLRLVSLFRNVSLLLTPTVAAKVPLLDADGVLDGKPDPNWVRFTYPFNLTRSPAGTVCAGFTTEGLPVGLQVVGPQHADVAVLRLLATLEDELGLAVAPPVDGGRSGSVRLCPVTSASLRGVDRERGALRPLGAPGRGHRGVQPPPAAPPPAVRHRPGTGADHDHGQPVHRLTGGPLPPARPGRAGPARGSAGMVRHLHHRRPPGRTDRGSSQLGLPGRTGRVALAERRAPSSARLGGPGPGGQGPWSGTQGAHGRAPPGAPVAGRRAGDGAGSVARTVPAGPGHRRDGPRRRPRTAQRSPPRHAGRWGPPGPP